MKVIRKTARYSVNPITARYDEELLFNGSAASFRFVKSRFLNPRFYSDANFEALGIKMKIESRYRHVTLSNKVTSQIKVPVLFPFLSIGKFQIELPEGVAGITIGRKIVEKDKMYGAIEIMRNSYPYAYKFASYSREEEMFPNGGPPELSKESMLSLVFSCLWINAYNAGLREV